MTKIEVLLEDQLVGWISHDIPSNRFAFTYADAWRQRSSRYALSPHIPLVPKEGQTAEAHSAAVRQFFENLMPEGQALDEAASANKISKSNLVGLMLALGRETAGALRLFLENAEPQNPESLPATRRLLPRDEMSMRIRSRPYQPFSVWDGKVRLSIAGFQDKIAVLKDAGEWYLVEGAKLASTVILKPEPASLALAGLTSNEFLCMRLAHNARLPVAGVSLVTVPEPVLEVIRFDRIQEANHVRRLHVIDGCQALGLSSAFKYERPYGSGPDVKHIRDGASLPAFFEFLKSSRNPAVQRLQMLRWVIFQVLIGNTDAHAKNLSFFCSEQGCELAPAYDLVSTLAFSTTTLEDSFSMSIGDAFLVQELSPYEWANFAVTCGLSPKLVATELKKLASKVLDSLAATTEEVLAEGADRAVVDSVCSVIRPGCLRQMNIAGDITKIDVNALL